MPKHKTTAYDMYVHKKIEIEIEIENVCVKANFFNIQI